ncbi:hypothetical protein C8J56DRAFT_900660 [Mycena floridula]|nr:hypothetical protein C8J56DRAFT_900660 [Mycena floridula]
MRRVFGDHICVDGGAQRWIESKNQTPLASHITPEVCRVFRFVGSKFDYFCLAGQGALPEITCCGRFDCLIVRVLVEKYNTDDDAQIPSTAYNLNKPVLFVAFTKDDIGLPLFGDATLGQYAKGPMTRAEVAGDHWAVVSHAPEINDILVRWIKALDLGDSQWNGTMSIWNGVVISSCFSV